MNKEEFLKQLSKNLRYLKPNIRKTEISKYENLSDYNLNPEEEANKIYKSYNLNINISKIKFLDAFNILINRSTLKDILLFFLYTILLIILIKIPFIYIRDMLSTLFSNLRESTNYMILYLTFEFLYALTSIYFLIKQIKKKALTLEDINHE